MPKQGENPLQDYFKVSNEDVNKTVCILCNKNLSRGSKDPHKMTTTAKFWLQNIPNFIQISYFPKNSIASATK